MQAIFFSRALDLFSFFSFFLSLTKSVSGYPSLTEVRSFFERFFVFGVSRRYGILLWLRLA